MNSFRKYPFLLPLFTLGVIWGVALFFTGTSWAETEPPPAGQMVNFKGHVRVMTLTGETETSPRKDQPLQAGDMIVTGADGWAAILMADETLIQLNRNTQFVLKSVETTAGWHALRGVLHAVAKAPGRSVYQVKTGEMWLRNKNQNARITVETPTISAGIRGTEVDTVVFENQTVTMTVLEGEVQGRNPFGEISAGPGEMIYAEKGMRPQKRILVSPPDAVQWTLLMPPIDDLMLADGTSRDPDLQQAALKLEGGEVIGAKKILEKRIEKTPEYGPANTLLALISIARGENSSAVSWAEKGVQFSPKSPAAHLTLCQAYQTIFDLDSAMESVTKALSLDPSHVPALVLKAKLLFGSDQTDQALETIDTAFRLAPKDPDVLNLRGFLFLSSREIDKASTAFTDALKQEPGMAEPHLGMALIHMRQGNVADALEEITTAVLLDPRRSVFMSYWAKMLYQVKRFGRALEALDYAEKLDPNDPTPLLYRAIILRDLNRPTEAILALNRAAALNGNRAVYRSRFLLDRDLAVTNVNQTVIFNGLGLNEWARSKALASVKTDYHNSAAHTFLAGSLLAMGDRLRSGASENLLGMMLQQANLNSLNSFQEYTSFFEKPSVSGVVSGTYGNFDTLSGEAIVSGAIPSANLAFNTIVDGAKSDGWRDTNGGRTQGAGAVVKWDPSPKDGVLLISSVLNTRTRDTRNDPYEYDASPHPDDWQTVRSDYVTLGYHRRFSTQADLLLMGKHYDGDFRSLSKASSVYDRYLQIGLFTESKDDIHIPTDQVQAHLLLGHKDHQFILGSLQHFRKRTLDNETSDEYWQLYEGWWYYIDGWTGDNQKNLHDWYQSYYLQDIWRISPWLTAEAALYYDVLENHNLYTGVDQNQEKWNPRLGLIFSPTSKDTIRMAGFRYLVPFTIDRLDPTDIGGVPLFRNAYDNSTTEEYDVAWEHEWKTGFVSLGAFYLESEVAENWSDGTSTTWRAYARGIEPAWNQLLWNGVGLGVRYRFLDITDDYSPEKDREDHLVAVTVSYLHPRGFFAGLSESYRRENFDLTARKDEDIFLTDLSLGYQFPKKWGILRVDVRNLMDEHFNWIVDDMVFTGRVPERELSATLSLFF